MIHIGGNDIGGMRSLELVDKYKNLIKDIREKGHFPLITGIVPRMREGSRWYSKAFEVNNTLKSLCAKEGITFINPWNDFYGKSDLFKRDGVHFNEKGTDLFCNKILSQIWEKAAISQTLT